MSGKARKQRACRREGFSGGLHGGDIHPGCGNPEIGEDKQRRHRRDGAKLRADHDRDEEGRDRRKACNTGKTPDGDGAPGVTHDPVHRAPVRAGRRQDRQGHRPDRRRDQGLHLVTDAQRYIEKAEGGRPPDEHGSELRSHPVEPADQRACEHRRVEAQHLEEMVMAIGEVRPPAAGSQDEDRQDQAAPGLQYEK